MSLADFEKAVLIAFDQSGSADAALKQQAQAYCDGLKASPDAWVAFVQGFQGSGFAEVKFWCLQVRPGTHIGAGAAPRGTAPQHAQRSAAGGRRQQATDVVPRATTLHTFVKGAVRPQTWAVQPQTWVVQPQTWADLDP